MSCLDLKNKKINESRVLIRLLILILKKFRLKKNRMEIPNKEKYKK
tara:strand:- start:390 stop:527 length:138 start_codon:yes stop_codon:yes gene_type:complete